MPFSLNFCICSYNEQEFTCYVPHDNVAARLTPLELYGRQATGFVSYFMQERTIPAFSEEYSGVGKLYWRNAVGDRQENLDLLGVYSLHECYVACQLTTEGSCWVFR